MISLTGDWGGTRLKLAVSDGARILAQESLPSNSKEPLRERLPDIGKTWQFLLASEGLTPADCGGIGVTIPGLVDPGGGRAIAMNGKFEDAPELDLSGWARAAFGLPLVLENDARAALIGEWQYGAGKSCDNLVMITLGTGLGTAVLMQGEVVRGAHGEAGVLGGHFTVQVEGGLRCSCGNRGCAEAEASSSVLEEQIRSAPGFFASCLSREKELNYKMVFEVAAQGDELAVEVRQHTLKVWGALAVNLIHAYDPERIIWAGGIMENRDILLPALQNYIDQNAWTPWGRVECRVATWEQPALAGCAWLAEQNVKEKNHAKTKL